MKKMETTKIVMIIMTVLLSLITIVLSIFSVMNLIVDKDSTLIQILIPCVFTELASYTGWYCWKSKSENKLKIILGFVKELSSEDIKGKEEIVNNLISNL